MFGDLGRGRKAAQLLGQAGSRTVDLHRQLLEPARQADVPDVVAEVAPQLAEDGRHGERGKRLSPRWIEAVDGFHQPEAGDLDQVVQGLGMAPIPSASERARGMNRRTSSSRTSGERSLA